MFDTFTFYIINVIVKNVNLMNIFPPASLPSIKLMWPLNALHAGKDVTGRGNDVSLATDSLEYAAGPRGQAKGSLHLRNDNIVE